MLQSETHCLRALERSDVEFLYQLENNPDEWWMGATLCPMSKATLEAFATGQHDLFRDLQLRLMLDQKSGKTVGAVDLYALDPRNQRAGVGIAIGMEHRQEGHASAGLKLLKEYAFDHLGLHQLWAEVPAGNAVSLRLFEQAGFERTGHMKEWIRQRTTWSDAVFMQALSKPPLR